MENATDNNAISLLDLLKSVKKHLILVILIIVGFTALGFSYGYFVKPVSYQAKGTLVTQVPLSSSTTPGDNYYGSVISILLTNSIVELMQTQRVYNATYERLVAKKEAGKIQLNTITSSGQIASGIRVNASEDSTVINVAFISKDGNDAIVVLNEYISTIVDEVNSVDQTTGSPEFVTYNNKLKIWAKANSASSSHNYKTITFLSFFVGVLVAGLTIILMNYIDDHIRNKEELESILETNAIAVIPYLEPVKNRGVSNEK